MHFRKQAVNCTIVRAIALPSPCPSRLPVIWRTTDTPVFTLHQRQRPAFLRGAAFGALDGSRTHSLRRRRATLYPVALRVRSRADIGAQIYVIVLLLSAALRKLLPVKLA